MEEYVVEVYVKTWVLIVNLDISNLYFTSAVNDLLSLLKNEPDKPEIYKLNNNLKVVIKDCTDNCFQTFGYRREYDKKF